MNDSLAFKEIPFPETILALSSIDSLVSSEDEPNDVRFDCTRPTDVSDDGIDDETVADITALETPVEIACDERVAVVADVGLPLATDIDVSSETGESDDALASDATMEMDSEEVGVPVLTPD